MAYVAGILPLFQQLDSTGSGTIGLDKMQSILVSTMGWTPAEVDEVLATYNADSKHDLNYADFLMWLFDPDGSQEAAASVPVGEREEEEEEEGALAPAPDDMHTSKAAASVPVEEREEEKEATAPAPAPDDTNTSKAAASVPVEEREEEKEETAPALAADDTNTSKAAASVPMEEREEEEEEEAAPAPAADDTNTSEVLPLGWGSRQDAEGRTYYIDMARGAAQQEKPEVVHVKYRGRLEAMQAVKSNGCNLRYCSQKLRGDRVVALEAVKLNGLVLVLCSEKLRNDKEVAMEAVRQNWQALEFCSETLRNDKDMAMEALKRCPIWRQQLADFFELLSKELRNDKELAIEAVKWYGPAFEFCSEELRSDRDVVMEAVKEAGEALQFCSEELRSDRDVVMEAVKQYGPALQFCSEELRSDRDVVMEAVKQNGDALQYCSQELRGDKVVVMEAAQNSQTALKFALKGLNQDPECLKVAGLMRESGASTERRSEKGIFSVKFGFSEQASNLSTIVADGLAKHPDMCKFEIYNPNLYCKKSCDPEYTNWDWPCRGTKSTCTKEKDKITTDAAGRPTNESCWRLSFRLHQEICKETGGFMLQLEEYGQLGKGQQIETLMAEELDLKIFRIKWNEPEKRLNYQHNRHALVNQIADAVLDWFADEKSDTKIEVIEANLEYKRKRLGAP